MLCSLLFHCCLCLATPLPPHNVTVIPFPNLHTLHSTLTCRQNRCDPARFCTFSVAILFTPHHFYQHTLHFTLPLNKFPNRKLFFPRRFLHSTLLTTQTKTLLQPHRLSPICFNYIIPATFAENAIQFPTSTPLRLPSTPPSIIDFRPTFLISTLIRMMLLLCNNTLMFKCLVLTYI